MNNAAVRTKETLTAQNVLFLSALHLYYKNLGRPEEIMGGGGGIDPNLNV